MQGQQQLRGVHVQPRTLGSDLHGTPHPSRDLGFLVGGRGIEFISQRFGGSPELLPEGPALSKSYVSTSCHCPTQSLTALSSILNAREEGKEPQAWELVTPLWGQEPAQGVLTNSSP